MVSIVDGLAYTFRDIIHQEKFGRERMEKGKNRQRFIIMESLFRSY